MNKSVVVHECKFKAIRSSGAGGQHVNKVSSKIELLFDLEQSAGLTVIEKERLRNNLSNKLTKEGMLLLQCSESRSQHRNKDLVIKRFLSLLEKGLIVKKKRKSTTPSKKSILKRLKNKTIRKRVKDTRKKPDLD